MPMQTASTVLMSALLQVDLCIQSVGWDLVFVSAAQVEDWARTLRTTGLRPRKVWLRGGDKFHHLPMSPDVQHVWQKVESLKVAAPLLSASYVEVGGAHDPLRVTSCTSPAGRQFSCNPCQ
jgi:hypothetical protein